ncbi:MAG: hypothetical protein OXD32_02925 [Endozoicomonadaceae bacterium]|nr:hypothetical protein [Endozoicomonadaceae bacterium]
MMRKPFFRGNLVRVPRHDETLLQITLNKGGRPDGIGKFISKYSSQYHNSKLAFNDGLIVFDPRISLTDSLRNELKKITLLEGLDVPKKFLCQMSGKFV